MDACDVTSGCACDYTCDTAIRLQDLFDYLGCYFGAPAVVCGSTTRSGDFNQSGTVTVQDIFDFLSCWFAATCP